MKKKVWTGIFSLYKKSCGTERNGKNFIRLLKMSRRLAILSRKTENYGI